MVRCGNCLTAVIFIAIAVLNSGCATLLTGKKQQIPVDVSDSNICVYAYLPVTETKTENPSLSDDMGSLPLKKSDYYRVSQPITNGYVSLPRPNPNQTIYIGLNQCIDSASITFATCNQKYSATFNEPALLNFILPWNWMIDAATGSLFRWKINKPLTQ